MYHVSDIKKFLRCPRFLYLSQEDHLYHIPYFRNDEALTTVFAQKLKIKDCFVGQKNDPKERFLQAYNNYEWFIKSRLEADGLRVKIPIIHRLEYGVDVYFTHYGIFPKDSDLDFYRFNIAVVKANGFKINHIYIIHLNANYILDGRLNIDELFVISEYLYNDAGKPSFYLNDLLKYRVNLKSIVTAMENHQLDDYRAIKKRICDGKNPCPYYSKCFKDDCDLPDDSILTLVSSKNKHLMHRQGIKCLKDAKPELIEGSRLQYAQIMASKNGGLFFEKYPLMAFLKKLEARPITFIDFEWDRYLIPPFQGLKPCSVVCFEFASYVLDEKGEMHHHTFVGTKDCRKDFVENLLNSIPSQGPIVAYNAIGAEVLRIKELAEQFGEYKDELLKITERFIDLSYPFTSGIVYSTRMRGNFSLKQLVAVVSDLSYQNLDIHDGMSAVAKWRSLDDKEDNENKLEHLKAYCSLDAYGLYLVYEWLLKLIS